MSKNQTAGNETAATPVALTMSKEDLTSKLKRLVDPEKQLAFAGGLYVSVMLNNQKGLFFGGLRDFVCEVFPAISKAGKFGDWSPMLGKVVGILIDKNFIRVEERAAKTPKGNNPKFHVMANESSCLSVMDGLNAKWGAKFVDFVNQATKVYEDEDSNGGGDWGKMANDFVNFYA